jgi:hypothetical protein
VWQRFAGGKPASGSILVLVLSESFLLFNL